MARWGVAVSRPRTVVGWLSEKRSELTLRLDETVRLDTARAALGSAPPSDRAAHTDETTE
jgi:hypothetical protein